MKILALDAAAVRAACPMADAIDAVSHGFRALSRKEAEVPPRTHLNLGRDHEDLLVMPARLDDSAWVSVKLVSIVPTNRDRGLSAVNATVILMEKATGVPVALLEGSSLTALRTGAAGGLAARLLSRANASVVALYGAGVQARSQLEAVMVVRELREVRVAASSMASAERFARSFEARPELRIIPSDRHAARGADIVICATSSATPVFDGADLGPGVHITGIGSYRPDMREIPPDAFCGAQVVVDNRAAARQESGELIEAINRHYVEPSAILEIGEAEARRTSDEQRTLFKSVGNAVQDLAVAALVYEHAKKNGIGTWVHL